MKSHLKDKYNILFEIFTTEEVVPPSKRRLGSLLPRPHDRVVGIYINRRITRTDQLKAQLEAKAETLTGIRVIS